VPNIGDGVRWLFSVSLDDSYTSTLVLVSRSTRLPPMESEEKKITPDYASTRGRRNHIGKKSKKSLVGVVDTTDSKHGKNDKAARKKGVMNEQMKRRAH